MGVGYKDAFHPGAYGDEPSPTRPREKHRKEQRYAESLSSKTNFPLAVSHISRIAVASSDRRLLLAEPNDTKKTLQ